MCPQKRQAASRLRVSEPVAFDLELDSGDVVQGCGIGSCWGPASLPVGGLWYSLVLPR